MCGHNCLFVTGSLILTLTFLAVGVSFFGPYWLSNLGSMGAANETHHASPPYLPYLPGNKSVYEYPDRGLWAQCGKTCFWFWQEGQKIQNHILTPLKWHLATQVLYFIGAFLILAAEIYARAQLCCGRRRGIFAMLGIVVLVSALLQTGAIAAFGAGASAPPYNVLTDPTQIAKHMGQAFDPIDNPVAYPYLGWCFWMAVAGDILSVVSGTLFLLTACFHKSDYDD